jgi:hypothetical protein
MQCTRTMQSRQRGLTMIGFMFVAVVLVMIAILAMKVAPAYMEFFSVKKILNTMGQEPELKSMSNADIRHDFEKRADVDYVTAVKPADLTIDRQGAVPVVTADYTYRTQLVGNVSLVVDFHASTDPSAAAVE